MRVNIKDFNEFPTAEIYDFDRQFSFDSYLLIFLLNFIKAIIFKS